MQISERMMCPRFTFVRHSSRFNQVKIGSVPKLRLKRDSKLQGQVIWWEKPVYSSPIVKPLERGIDFTFQDGRPLFATSQRQMVRKLTQIELGKKIVGLLEEIKEAEELWKRNESTTKLEEENYKRWQPSEKGQKQL